MATQQVGSLIISLEARTAQIQQDMAQTKRIVGDAMGDIRKEAGRTADAMEDVASTARMGAIGAGALVAVQGLAALKDQVIEIARELNQAQIAGEKLQKTLFYANGGDIQAIAADIDWLHQVANQLGLDFSTASAAYARFAGAVKGSGLEGRAREIFEAVSMAGSAFGLSLEESEGAMRALVQMSAKGVVAAEEFRGQLADHLPVASQAAARALGVTTGEFSRMLVNGEVLADDFLPKFARALREMSQDAANFGGEAQKASARFTNAWEDMKREVAASGVGAFVSGQLAIMSDAFNDFSASIRRARAEGSGFWGQAAAGGGAALRFLNPMNAASYRAQSDQGRIEQLKASIADKKTNLFEWSWSESLTQKMASIKAMETELAGLEKRAANVGKGANAGAQQAAAAEARLKAARARADDYVKNGKRQTDKEAFEKDLREEDAAFKGAVAGLQQNSKEYLAALAAHEERKSKLIDDYNKKNAPKKQSRAAQYGSQEDRELAALRAQIASQQQLASELARYGAEADKLTPGQKLLNQLTAEGVVAKTAAAKAHISAKQALAQELVTLELANRHQREAIALRQRYETPLQREQRESADNLTAINRNSKLSAVEQARMRGLEQARSAQVIGDMQQGVRNDLGVVPESEKLIQAHQEMQRRINEVTAAGSAERVQLELAANRKLQQDTEALERQKASLVLGMSGQVFDGMASLAENAAGRQSAAYKVMFLASKAAAIAMAIVNTEEAATKALTMGPILGVPAATMIRGLGYASVGVMAAQAIQGMAHDGIDTIPREGTWLLDKGERVVDSRTNADLKEYLKQARSGGNGGISIVINDQAGVDVQASQTTGSNGEAQLTLDIVRRIAADTVDSKLAAAKRPGGMLYG